MVWALNCGWQARSQCGTRRPRTPRHRRQDIGPIACLEAGAEEGMHKVRPLSCGLAILLILGLLQVLMEPGWSMSSQTNWQDFFSILIYMVIHYETCYPSTFLTCCVSYG
ncbi:hypothetical protein BDV41DRAFT_410124 [Aspergillus transmontanensis]|uniref:Uncharacterized protein n=1 Tax=Aspergillus transmontanensis TaxID=1034304 RepID=A0A5N6VNG4_9EURO|nr:hypothetical protein BDV41DRAFT_410124 [Aspergillus transmontanensis]